MPALEPMNPAPRCPRCGADLPADNVGGQCPRCLVQVIFGSLPAPGAASPATAKAATLSLPHRIGDYELLEEIGRGGMGVVYRARQLSLHREVAVKAILAGPVANADAVARFHAEAEALAGLRHPHIVAIYDILQQDGLHCFAMEYVPGSNLAQLTQEHPLVSEDTARHVAQVAAAIQFAHEHGILHRDLKPSNILVDAFGQPRVTDFGLAKRLNAEADLTYTGQLLGSPQYFAPEQLSARKGAIGPHTDICRAGQRNWEIAQQLHRSTATVRNQLHGVFGKFGGKEPDRVGGAVACVGAGFEWADEQTELELRMRNTDGADGHG